MLNDINKRSLVVAVLTSLTLSLLNVGNATASETAPPTTKSSTTDGKEQVTQTESNPTSTESSATGEQKAIDTPTPIAPPKLEISIGDKTVDDLIKSGDAASASGDFFSAEQYYLIADTNLSYEDRQTIKPFTIQNNLADVYNKQDRLKEALACLEKALKTLQSMPEATADGALRTKTQFKVASAYFRAGVPKRALVEANTALCMFDKYSLDDQLLRARILGMLGSSLTSEGLFKEADETFKQALQAVSEFCPPPGLAAGTTPTPAQLRALVIKGQILSYKATWKALLPGKEDEAKTIAREAYKCMQQGYGTEKGDTIFFEMSFKQQLLNKDTYLQKAQEILDTANKEYGPESLEALVGLKELAVAQFGQNKFAQSVATCEKGIKLCEKLLPPDTSREACFWSRMGFANMRLGDKMKAATNMKKAYEIAVANTGENSLAVAGAAESLAMVYAVGMQLNEAEQLYLKAWKVNESLLGRNNKVVLGNLSNLGAIYTCKGKSKEATQYTYWAYVGTRQLYGANSVNLSVIAGNLGMLYLRSGNLKEANSLIKQHLALEAKFRGTQRPEYADALVKEAQIRLLEGNIETALANFGKAFHVKEKALGLKHQETYVLMCAYYDFLRRLGRTEQANALQARYKIALAKKT